MVSFEKRKGDLSLLRQMFPKQHPSFQIVNSRVDEIETKFIDNNGEVHVIHANIADDGLTTVWFSESEKIEDILSHLTISSHRTNGILAQVNQLVSMLCELFSMSKPEELEILDDISQTGNRTDCPTAEKNESSDDEDVAGRSENYYSEDDASVSSEAVETSDVEGEVQPKKRIWPLYSNEGIPEEGMQWMNTIRSICASSDKYGLDRRLADELRELYQSDEYKTGMYSFEMCFGTSESRIWLVNLYKGNGNRPLTELVPNMRELYGEEYLVIKLIFSEEYPFKQMMMIINTPETEENRDGCIVFEMDQWLPTISIKEILNHIADKIVDADSIPLLENERYRRERARRIREQREQEEMEARIRLHHRRWRRRGRRMVYRPEFTRDPRSIQYYKN